MNTKAMDEWRNELAQVAPELSKLPKMDVFTVDDQYFEALPTLVMNKIHEKRTRKFILDFSWLLRPVWAVTVAACLTIMITGSFLLLKPTTADKPMPVAEVNQLLNEPLSEDAVIDDVDEGTMMEAIAAKPKPTDKPTNTKKAKDKKAIEEYILDNVDESSIIDNL